MGTGTTVKRRRTTSASDSLPSNTTPSRAKPLSGRGRGRPPNAPRDGRERPPALADSFKRRCNEILDRLIKKDYYNIFLEPVNTDEVVGYTDIIKQPMDFTTMRANLDRHHYKSLGEFRKHLDLIWTNCLLFNGKEPINVFSKKAIELRRLTEKLIVSTRQQLEKDKETLNQWKEKHRRRKESLAANLPSHLHNHLSSLEYHNLPNRTQTHPHPPNSARDSIDGLIVEFPPEEHTGRTPQQTALAESLRLQYAGTSGLYKKSSQNPPLPQYTQPDGSIVEIPLTPYNPTQDHWSTSRPPINTRVAIPPQLFCDSLPSLHTSNPCAPRPNSNSVRVQDYASSVFQFVRNADPNVQKIATDLLSPELAVKVQQDKWKAEGYSLPELAKYTAAARSARLDYVPKYSWNSDTIVQLADDIERANRKNLSILPKLPRAVPELDGMKILERFLKKELVKQVDDVSLQVIDYAMPHGVTPQTLHDLRQLKRVPAINLSPTELGSLDKLTKTAEDFVTQQTPEQRSRLTGASLLSKQQLDELQVKAHNMRRQRRLEAERQAVVMSQYMAVTGPSVSSVPLPSSKRKRDIDSATNSQHSHRTADRRSSLYHPAANAKRAAEHMPVSIPHTQGRFPPGLPAVSPPNARIAPIRNGMNYPPPPPQKNNVLTCSNCGTSDSGSWHPGAMRATGMERLCLPCAVYWGKMQQPRPRELWAHATGRKPPVSANQHIQPAMMSPPMRGQPGALPIMRSPVGTPAVGSSSAIPSPALSNGIAKRGSQRSARSSPASRRSPSVLSSTHKKFAEMQKLPAAIGMAAPNVSGSGGVPNVSGSLRGTPNVPGHLRGVASMQGMHKPQGGPTVGPVLAGRSQGVAHGVQPAHTISNPTPPPPALAGPGPNLNAPIMQPQNVQMTGANFTNGLYRTMGGNVHGNSGNGDVQYPMGVNGVAMGGRQMTLPQATNAQAGFVPVSQNNGQPNLVAFRQSLGQGNLSGQGVFATRNAMMGGVANGGILPQAVHGNAGMMGTMHAGNVQPGVPGQASHAGIASSANVGKSAGVVTTPFGADGSQKKVGPGGGISGAPQRIVSQGFDGAEIMGGFGGGDVFINNGNANGVVTGSGNMDGGLLFYDGDLGQTSTAPDLEF